MSESMDKVLLLEPTPSSVEILASSYKSTRILIFQMGKPKTHNSTCGRYYALSHPQTLCFSRHETPNWIQMILLLASANDQISTHGTWEEVCWEAFRNSHVPSSRCWRKTYPFLPLGIVCIGYTVIWGHEGNNTLRMVKWNMENTWAPDNMESLSRQTLKSLCLDLLLGQLIKPALFNHSQKHPKTPLCNLQLLI